MIALRVGDGVTRGFYCSRPIPVYGRPRRVALRPGIAFQWQRSRPSGSRASPAARLG
jgi:hypothetical protein